MANYLILPVEKRPLVLLVHKSRPARAVDEKGHLFRVCYQWRGEQVLLIPVPPDMAIPDRLGHLYQKGTAMEVDQLLLFKSWWRRLGFALTKSWAKGLSELFLGERLKW